MTTKDTKTLHIYFLLDRSGSMASMASDVMGGFNTFLATQAADGDDALMTLVQFDSENSHEVIADAKALREIARLDESTFQPRGGTPLYDAVGRLVSDATVRAMDLALAQAPSENILVVIFTDGEENQSVEHTRKSIFDLISSKEKEGWTFVYMGANHDVYAEGGQIGMYAGNSQAYRADGLGSAAAFASVDKAVTNRRNKLRTNETIDAADFFQGDKAAEDDLRNRPTK